VQSADQREGFASLEAVPLDGLAHRLLVPGLKPAEHVRQGHADGARIDPAGRLVAEVLEERQTRAHPARLVAAGPGDGCDAQLVLVAQGPDDPGLVHRAERAWWAVGKQQRGLGLGTRAQLLQHHRHLLEAERLPALEALESVEHLEGAIWCRQHPQGKLGELCVRIGRLAAATQRREARAQLFGRHEADTWTGLPALARRTVLCCERWGCFHCESPAVSLRATRAVAPAQPPRTTSVRLPEARAPDGNRPRRPA